MKIKVGGKYRMKDSLACYDYVLIMFKESDVINKLQDEEFYYGVVVADKHDYIFMQLQKYRQSGESFGFEGESTDLTEEIL